ncbi:hypothetical protein GCM10007216_12440 [Thalassobacillus devorans]|uniref:AMP-dependent synthetase/ligase domain-containing protein n=1 Tax=Thalassobacillus devorans TaxID=279813 RepID=A0ABQ1NR25_9BACI|nr:long-chain acyl-CoA synthetase [Thalassobacillus devorans]GGC83341.1 hypothetical protein GCM10007216_12440 [Thalassobacillus devorans]
MEKVWKKHYPDRIKSEVDIPDIALTEFLTKSVEQFPDNTAITFFNKTISYKELSMQVAAFASSLQDRGVQKSDRVAIMLPNCPHLVIMEP